MNVIDFNPLEHVNYFILNISKKQTNKQTKKPQKNQKYIHIYIYIYIYIYLQIGLCHKSIGQILTNTACCLADTFSGTSMRQ